MKLTKTPKIVKWPETHYVYVEKLGSFQVTAQKAWMKLRKLVPKILANNEITGFTSLYQIEPKMIYRAGVQLAAKPKKLPIGLKYIKFKGGKYSRFLLTGSYMNLPEACGTVFEIVEKKKIKVRKDFYLENYLNDPDTTPENKLKTEILVPTV